MPKVVEFYFLLKQMERSDSLTLVHFKLDELVKSRKTPFFVIPAKAGIQLFQLVTEFLDSGFHRSDDFLRDRQTLVHL